MLAISHTPSSRMPFGARLLGSLKNYRSYIFIGMLAVSIGPLLLMLVQSERSALERELRQVEQKHLIIAQNLAEALGRYVADLSSTFEFVVDARETDINTDAATDLLSRYNVKYVTIFDVNDWSSEMVVGDMPEAPSIDILKELRAETKPSGPSFGSVKQVNGKPQMFVMKNVDRDRIAIAAYDLDYIYQLQKAIAFGRRGHSMIVDHTGRVLAHPKKEWEEISKDATKLSVVRQMISRQTGVTQFYSPPMQADMVTGYTFVEPVGWGVMVPQPLEELRESAATQLYEIAALISLLGAFALLGSWGLSGLISQPISKLAKTAKDIENGERDARVPEFSATAPSELSGFRQMFNKLLDKVNADEALLVKSLSEAQAANKAKSQFIAVLSHEMRTPLNGIVATLDLFEGTTMSDEQHQYLSMLHTSAGSLKRHVNDVLDLTQLSSGKMPIKKSTFDLIELTSSIISSLEHDASKNGNELFFSSDGFSSMVVESDYRLIEKILYNMVGNAVKYTHGGDINVDLKSCFGNEIELTVRDTGIGLDPGDVDRIFKPFVTLNSRNNRSTEGTGLGLSIVSSIVKTLDGKISVDSQIGEGTTFKVTLPLSIPENRIAEPVVDEIKAAAVANSRYSGASVLVVDDNEINLVILSRLLEKLGLTVTRASDGKSAVSAANMRKFDLILMDISMPDIDGLEASELIRSKSLRNSTTTIIAQTANALTNDAVAFEDAGIQDALIKPIMRQSLTEMLDKYLDVEASRPKIGEAEREAESILQHDKVDEILEALGDKRTNAYVETIAQDVRKLLRGLQQKPLPEDYIELAKIAHRAAGTCAVMGAERLQSALCECEFMARAGNLGGMEVLQSQIEKSHLEFEEHYRKIYAPRELVS